MERMRGNKIAEELKAHGLGIQQFVPYNAKIADITHADTNLHTLDLAVALGETRKIVVVQLQARRMAGTGVFAAYPNEGANQHQFSNYEEGMAIIRTNMQRLQYSLSVAGDDWDIYCFGYVVEV